MRGSLLGILLFFKYSICADELNFEGDIRDFAVGNNKVYVLTDDRLHQMRHNLTIETERYISNATHSNRVNILVYFGSNKTLITCGTLNCGYCEVLDENDITKSLHRESILVGPWRKASSVAFIVDIKSQKYLLVGKENEESPCGTSNFVSLWNTQDEQYGGIFSKSNTRDTPTPPYIHSEKKVQLVDGFQLNLSSYLFLNVMTENGSASLKVQLLRTENKGTKADTLKSLRGATLKCCEDKQRRRLLSSTVIKDTEEVLWAGVFSAENARDTANNALAIYDISQELSEVHDFCDLKENAPAECKPVGRAGQDEKILTPKTVVFRYRSILSVAAEKNEPWVALFIGTEEGQLIKLVLDKDLNPTCPMVLYKSDNGYRFFPRMLFDPVDRSHIYIALKNQMRRVSVAQCGEYNTMGECRSAPDPLCGWCVSKSRCSIWQECHGSIWVNIPGDVIKKELNISQVTLRLRVIVKGQGRPAYSCFFKTESGDLCETSSQTSVSVDCSCTFSSHLVSAEGLRVTAAVTVEKQTITEEVTLKNCSSISEGSAYTQCVACVSAGCVWSGQRCAWPSGSAIQTQDVCRSSELKYEEPEILSVEPNVISFHGRNNVRLRGKNLNSVTKVRVQWDLDCNPKDSPVLQRSSDNLIFHIPGGIKGTARVCVVTPDGGCHGNTAIFYGSQPSCTNVQPRKSWASGNRSIQVVGSNLEFVEAITLNDYTTDVSFSSGVLRFQTPPLTVFTDSGPFPVLLKAGNKSLACQEKLLYHPDPEFTSFTTSPRVTELLVTIQKKADSLTLNNTEIKVWGRKEEDEWRPCVNVKLESSTDKAVVLCTISNTQDVKIDSLKIEIGHFSKILQMEKSLLHVYILIPMLILLVGIAVAVIIYRKNQRKMTERMNERLEMLESDIRNEIRQGFVDLQTEKAELVQNVAAIPFLDYKHFACRIFFPEGVSFMSSVIKDIGQDSIRLETQERYQALSELLRNQLFLTSFIHALEGQKNFSIKDKCMVASLLTLALHGDLPYLTEVMEQLLRDLIKQSNNSQPKLMLRRTESIVEKLLTNWMSICLYGFLRESVGQPLFLLVSALTQQISKGPVDSVTEKALYTLNEDWLLYQAQDFSALKLNVFFAVGTEGEVSEPLEVSALTCDTIEQVKEKILQTFQRKFGFRYTQQIREIDIEYSQEGSYVALQEVDASSDVVGDVTMLNTLKHYKIPDGASIKVITKKLHAPLSPQTSLKDDQNFSVKYFHLIDPDIEVDQRKGSERKKPKVKEVHLTKLLSTKVAVHSFVENLFKNIWTMPNNRAPPAVKYFFDFLDEQAKNQEITDPDVLHIWKTNSLPLRFWVNILKNPQFVFCDLEKTPHLDACLSVIAQAFMDSFSLVEQQLGKYSPTNKLLYAKDIPQYKQEVKAYYKLVKEQPAMSSQEFKDFLQEESKKHENDFNESVALRELYKYMQRYDAEIRQKLEQNDAPSRLKEKMQQVQELFEDIKRSGWE